MEPIGKTLAEQFVPVWEMLRTAVTQCSDEHWRNGGVPKYVPARWVLHVVESADFYSRPSPDNFSWGARFGVDWKSARPEQLPSREDTLSYMDDVRRHLDEWLRVTPDIGFVQTGSPFAWKGQTALWRMLYLLRHMQHHVGQLNQILRSHGLTPSKWR